jgi:hypothetical protein
LWVLAGVAAFAAMFAIAASWQLGDSPRSAVYQRAGWQLAGIAIVTAALATTASLLSALWSGE